jgi:hypothetical protein
MTKDQAFIEKLRTISVRTAPPWAEPLKDLASTSNDAESNQKVIIESERMKKNWGRTGKWGQWERERKATAMKNKPEWIRRGAKPEERGDAING